MFGLLIFLIALRLYVTRKRRYISIFLLFMLLTSCFQIIPEELMLLPSVGISKIYDWVLIFAIFVFLLNPSQFFSKSIWKDYKGIKLFLTLLILLLVYSIFLRGVEVSVSIRVFRNYLFFLTVFLFAPIPQEDYIKVLKLIIYFTALSAFAYCLQPIFGHALLNNKIEAKFEEAGIARYYNLPIFIIPVLFFFFLKNSILSLKLSKIFSIISFFAVILSQHRSLFLSSAVCFFLYLFLSKRIKVTSLFLYLIFAIIFFLCIDSLLGNRFSKGFNDLSSSSVKTSSQNINSVEASTLSTSDFRYYLFFERFLYVLKSPETTFLGIGFLTEDSHLTNHLPFNIGLTDDTGHTSQVDSSDIAWAPLILQFGLLGIFGLVAIYFGLLKKFLSLKKDPVMLIGFLYIIALFITSFYSNTIFQPPAICLLMFFAAYAYNLEVNESIPDKLGMLISAKESV